MIGQQRISYFRKMFHKRCSFLKFSNLKQTLVHFLSTLFKFCGVGVHTHATIYEIVLWKESCTKGTIDQPRKRMHRMEVEKRVIHLINSVDIFIFYTCLCASLHWIITGIHSLFWSHFYVHSFPCKIFRKHRVN